MLFESIHTPAKQASKLETLNSKAFQGMANKLFLAHGSPVILTTNINPSIGLFNGSIGSFIGALYIPKSYIVISLKILESASIDTHNRTTKQVEIITKSGQHIQLPKGAYLTQINNATFDQNVLDNLQEPFSAKFEIPCKPPFLPDYLVVKFPEYSKSGGPPFFNHPSMSDFVCIKRSTLSKKETHQEGYRHEPTRTGFPIELAFVMTAFKGIWDNHLRSEVMVKGFFNKNGVFLVGISRVRNPKHLYIHSDHWPSSLELKVQRLNPAVMESEHFERIVRVSGARDMRIYGFDLLENIPKSVDCDTFNLVGNIIQEEWLKIGSDVSNVNLNHQELIYKKMPHKI